MPGPNVPFPPMEAELVDTLPVGDRWQYEPKWDGFRGVLENDGGPLALWSRNGRPLLRYFPELARLGELLPPRSALDGEIVIEREGRLDFDAMQMRLHPAESRIRKLSKETPARYIAFDLLLWEGEPIHERPLAERRAELLRVAAGFDISPASRDVEQARRWLERLEAIGLDGVIAKRVDLAYMPGSRDAVRKVKRHKTADCVIVGYRLERTREAARRPTHEDERRLEEPSDYRLERTREAARRPTHDDERRLEEGSDYRTSGRGISTILLGLYRTDGTLDFVGHTSGITGALQEQLQRMLPPLRTASEATTGRAPGGESRWSRGKELEWIPVRPTLVCEIRFDKVEEDRFRHGTRFLRFRPDKEPRDCTWDQVRPRRRRGDPTLASLLGRA